MNYDLDIVLKSYRNVEMMLKGIPRSVWEIFLPEDADDLYKLESNILAFKRRDAERQQVMAIQQLCGFPLRPNESLQETKAKAKINGIKKDIRRKKRRDSDSDSLKGW